MTLMTGTPITTMAMTFPNVAYFISFILSLNHTDDTNMRKNKQGKKQKLQDKLTKNTKIKQLQKTLKCAVE